MLKNPKTASFLKTISFFSGLSDSEIEKIEKSAVVKETKKGELLFLHGEETSSFFVIIDGWVKASRTAPDGSESIISLFTKGNFFGENTIASDGIALFTAETLSKTILIEIPTSALKSIIKSNPNSVSSMLKSLTNQIDLLRDRVEHLCVMTASQRLGCFLFNLYTTQKKFDNSSIFLPYDKNVIASYLGIKPETFSRSLNKLKAENLISINGDEVHLLDKEALSHYSCGSCSREDSCTVLNKALSS